MFFLHQMSVEFLADARKPLRCSSDTLRKSPQAAKPSKLSAQFLQGELLEQEASDENLTYTFFKRKVVFQTKTCS